MTTMSIYRAALGIEPATVAAVIFVLAYAIGRVAAWL